MGRGALTDEVQEAAKSTLEREITLDELRLMPYIQNQVMDNMSIDTRKVTPDERAILMDWQERGWISEPASDLRVSEHFWNALRAILWVGYVQAGDSALD